MAILVKWQRIRRRTLRLRNLRGGIEGRQNEPHEDRDTGTKGEAVDGGEGRTAAEIARETGLDQSWISNFVNDKRKDRLNLVYVGKLADAIETTTDYLLNGEATAAREADVPTLNDPRFDLRDRVIVMADAIDDRAKLALKEIKRLEAGEGATMKWWWEKLLENAEMVREMDRVALDLAERTSAVLGVPLEPTKTLAGKTPKKKTDGGEEAAKEKKK